MNRSWHLLQPVKEVCGTHLIESFELKPLEAVYVGGMLEYVSWTSRSNSYHFLMDLQLGLTTCCNVLERYDLSSAAGLVIKPPAFVINHLTHIGISCLCTFLGRGLHNDTGCVIFRLGRSSVSVLSLLLCWCLYKGVFNFCKKGLLI